LVWAFVDGLNYYYHRPLCYLNSGSAELTCTSGNFIGHGATCILKQTGFSASAFI